MNDEKVIEIEGLSKSFGDIKAVQELSFDVRRGELFAFLGVNGAGKSTTISIMCGQLRKDGGSVRICGTSIDEDVSAVTRRLGVVFQSSVLDKPLSVRDNLKSRASLYGITGKRFNERLAELSELLDFKDLLDRPVSKLSGGQRRRIDIARALLHNPKILWSVISELRRSEGMTVFLTTHYMEEASDADYVIILDAGKVIAHGTPLDLKNRYTADYITLYGVGEEQVKALSLPDEKLRDGFRVSVPSTADATKLITDKPELFSDYEIVKGKMDDVFLAATGKCLAGGDGLENA